MLNLMVRFARPNDLAADDICECDRCLATCALSSALEMDLSQIELCIADEVPAGLCPDCEKGLMYVLEAD